MSRYITRPRKCEWDDYNVILPTTVTVHTAQDQAAKTGLLDHRGDAIYRVPEPIGFLRPKA
jgi:hypothetical protein